MRLAKQLGFLPVFFFMAACACGQDIHYNYDRGANFASYKTYQWVDIPSDAPGVPAGVPNLPSALPPPPPGFPPSRAVCQISRVARQQFRAVGQRISCSTRTLSVQWMHS